MRDWKSTDRVRGAASDIADSERAAGEAEDLGPELLAAVVRSAAQGVVILDGHYRIVYANPFACERLGYPLDRLLGQNRLALLREQDRPTYLAFLERARTGHSELSSVIVYRPDGSELEAESSATVLEVQGKRFFVVSSRDVTERRRRARQAAGLAQAVADGASDSIDAIIQAISEYAISGTRALAAWATLDDGGQVAAWIGAAGVPDGFSERLRRAAPLLASWSTVMPSLAAHGLLIHADARQLAEREPSMAAIVDALKSLPWQAAVCVHLQYRDAMVGSLTAIYREGEMPDQAETTFLRALAAHAAAATANARLLAAVSEKVTSEERQRLARELHDTVSQSLYAIQLGAQVARERLEQDQAGAAQIDHVLRLAEASQAEMRALIFELRPEVLETEGLVVALNRQIEALRARHGLAARVVTGAEPELPLEVKQALHRIGQEALWNTVKHARARRVEVRLQADAGTVLLEVADDGVGFDSGGSFPGHLGLRSMRERAAGAGGTLEIVSARGRGTRILVRIPPAPPGPPPEERTSRSLPPRRRRAA